MAQQISAHQSANRLPTALLVLLTFFTPVLWLFSRGSAEVNLSLGDPVLALAALWVGWRFLRHGLKLPLFALCCAAAVITLFSMLVNVWDTVWGIRPLGMGIEFVKVMMTWLYFYVTANLITSRASLVLMLKTWLIGSVLIALSGIGGSLVFEYTGLHNPFAMYYRAQGTLGNANFFSMHLGLSCFLAVLYWLLERRGGLWVASAIAIYLTGIFFSASRGGMLAVAVCTGLFLLVATPARAKLALAGVALLALLALVFVPNKQALIQSNPFTARLSTATVDLHDPAAAQRRELWRNAWEMFLESPVYGVGSGNSARETERKAGYSLEAHNTYLGLASEVGAVGLLIYLAAFGYFPVKALARGYAARDRRYRFMAWSLVCVFLSIALAGITSNVEDYRGLWMLMGFAYGFLLYVPAGAEPSHAIANLIRLKAAA